MLCNLETQSRDFIKDVKTGITTMWESLLQWVPDVRQLLTANHFDSSIKNIPDVYNYVMFWPVIFVV